MKSLRGRLTVWVFAALAVVLLLFSFVLDWAFASALRHQIDERLESEAAAVAGMVEVTRGGQLEFEYVGLAAFEARRHPAYFEVRAADGSVLGRSPSLGKGTLSNAGPGQSLLPDGREGRALVVRLVPPPRDGIASLVPVTVVVARGTEEIDHVRARLRLWLVALCAFALLVGAGAAQLAVGRGLQPAERLAADIGRLDETDLGRTLAATDVPRELEPVVVRLNDLLRRIDLALTREKRFSADVAHELRTPLAGLRTILEVTASRERSPAAYSEAIGEATAIVRDVSGLVENLLTLARLEAEPGVRRTDRVVLREVVEASWVPHRERAALRGLSFADEVDAAVELRTDEAKLRIVVGNLLDNAVEYTGTGGRVVVRCRPEDGVLLEVWDSGPPIPEDALTRLFDRFFRVDVARSGGAHCGIGLTLVRSLCDFLGLEISAHNGGDGSVSFRLRAKRP